MQEIRQLSDKDLSEDKLHFIKCAVVLFESPWCYGCKAVDQMIQGLSSDEAKGCQWGRIDVSVYQELAQRFGILSVPTLLVFKDGQETKRFIGKVSKEKLLSEIY